MNRGDFISQMRWFILRDRVARLLLISGWLAGLVYSITWLKTLSHFLMDGNIFAVLILVSVYLAFQQIWQYKHQLPNSIRIPKIHQSIGYGLILTGLAFFWTNLSQVWSQALGWSIVLVGLVLNQWGLSFFKTYRQSVILLLLSLYPGINIGAERLWMLLTPPKLLEVMMAWTTSHILQILGIASRLEGVVIYFSNSSVEVSSGCNGLQMIFAILWIGLLLTHQQFPRKLGRLSLVGCGLALVFNTIRVTFLTIVALSGDQSSFTFWHDSWGAQAFIIPLFLAYYFASVKLGFLPDSQKYISAKS
jgi:exosortase